MSDKDDEKKSDVDDAKELAGDAKREGASTRSADVRATAKDEEKNDATTKTDAKATKKETSKSDDDGDDGARAKKPDEKKTTAEENIDETPPSKPGPYRAVGGRVGDELSPYDRAWGSWDFPSFARKFPRDPGLDALVVAYAMGDFKRVSAEVPSLMRATDDDEVKAAALVLAQRTRPDPAAKLFFLLTAALLAFLTIWWASHDGPPKDQPAPAAPVPTVEYVK